MRARESQPGKAWKLEVKTEYKFSKPAQSCLNIRPIRLLLLVDVRQRNFVVFAIYDSYFHEVPSFFKDNAYIETRIRLRSVNLVAVASSH